MGGVMLVGRRQLLAKRIPRRTIKNCGTSARVR
jgi:hypothetical protein